MVYILVVAVLLSLVSAQLLPVHLDFPTTIDGYTFEFHNQKHLLLIMHGLDCFVIDVPEGSQLEKKMMDVTSWKATYAKIIPVIEAGNSQTRTELSQVLAKYGDMLLRALCFRSEIYNLDLNGI